MIEYSFVESAFQKRVALVVTPNTEIQMLQHGIMSRSIYIIKCTVIIFLCLIGNRKFAIYDHRNINIFLFLVITIPCKHKRDLMYVGDDGLHSLVVDQFKEKYLNWNTHYLKKFVLSIYRKPILELKRLHALQDNRKVSPKGSIFIDYYDQQEKSKSQPQKYKVLFIDQPTMVENLDDLELNKLKNRLKSEEDIKILLHPSRKNFSIFNDLNIETFRSNNIERDLKHLRHKVKVISYCSTVLIAALKYNHDVCILESGGLDVYIKDYTNACIESIRK